MVVTREAFSLLAKEMITASGATRLARSRSDRVSLRQQQGNAAQNERQGLHASEYTPALSLSEEILKGRALFLPGSRRRNLNGNSSGVHLSLI
jgi:hypothetical protein